MAKGIDDKIISETKETPTNQSKKYEAYQKGTNGEEGDINTPLAKEICAAINRCSRENASNTPDFILAEYLMSCLEAFESASMRREDWYGRHLSTGVNTLLGIKDDQAHLSKMLLKCSSCGKDTIVDLSGWVTCSYCGKKYEVVNYC